MPSVTYAYRPVESQFFIHHDPAFPYDTVFDRNMDAHGANEGYTLVLNRTLSDNKKTIFDIRPSQAPYHFPAIDVLRSYRIKNLSVAQTRRPIYYFARGL
jgi:hypothetical protein